LRKRVIMQMVFLAVVLFGCTIQREGVTPPENSPPPVMSSPDAPTPVETPPPVPKYAISPTATIQMPDGKTCNLTLEMTLSEVEQVLKAAGISGFLTDMYRYMLETSAEPREILQDCFLQFTSYDDDAVLTEIYVTGDAVSTDGGLGIGVERAKLEELYGSVQPEDVWQADTPEYRERPFYTIDSDWYSKSYLLEKGEDGVDRVAVWMIYIPTPEQFLKLPVSRGGFVNANLGENMKSLEKKYIQADIAYQKQENIESNTTCWSLDGFTLYFGTYAEYPEGMTPPDDPVSRFVLYQYTVHTSEYPTGKGIRVGDTEEKLNEVYGSTLTLSETDDAREYSCFLDPGQNFEGDSELVFVVQQGKITSWYVSIADQVLRYNTAN
jgi:hypothetical protein